MTAGCKAKAATPPWMCRKLALRYTPHAAYAVCDTERVSPGTGATRTSCRKLTPRHTNHVAFTKVRYTLHVAPTICDTLTVPHTALAVPGQAPKAAGSGTITATFGAKSAQTGAAFIGYIPT